MTTAADGGGGGGAPPSDLDLPTFLYLNPELPAYSNVATVEQALARYDEFAALPYRLPPLPPRFDARVYLAAQCNVSALNAAVRDAMLREGASAAALQRGGTYVATVMQAVEAGPAPRQFRVLDAMYALSASNLSPGDEVKVVRPGEEPLYGRVAEVARDSFTLCNEGAGAGAFAAPAGARCTLFGIKIYDAERQARVAYARNVAAGVETPPEDTAVGADFNQDMYQTLYPDVRAYSAHDAYLDYRFRWKRQTDFRVIAGDDVFNVRAPYSSNLLAGDLQSVTSIYCSGTGQIGAGNLTVTPCNASVRTDAWVGGTLTAVGGALLGMAGGVAGLSVGPSNVLVQGDVAVRDSLGVGMPAPDPAATGARLAVEGDIFTTGTVVTQSDARAKAALAPIEGALGIVSRLRGVTFRAAGAGEGARRHTGLLAQDVEAVLPEAVYVQRPLRLQQEHEHGHEHGPALRSVAYGNLAGVFVEAIKALDARLARLEAAVGGAGAVGSA